MASPAAARTDRGFRSLMTVLHLLALAGVLFLVWRARGYYLTPLTGRPFHAGYGLWRPAGDLGHGLGVAGTLALLLLLLYSVRKRTRLFGQAGRMSRWLSAHIFLGVWGPVLVTLHTSFKVQGLVAVSYWSMVAVALSGVLGRFLYRQIPRSLTGRELSAQEVAQRESELQAAVAAAVAEPGPLLADLDRLAVPPDRGALARLGWLLRRNLTLRADLQRVLSAHGLGRAPGALRALARERILLGRRQAASLQVQQAFHYWHVVHKPFAILMLIIMVVHVGVAIWLGYRWIF